jgi:hypothetical protein
MNKFAGFDSTTEERIRILHSLLKEDDRRRYAAVEAMRIGYGGVSYIARLPGCSPMTIDAGIAEIKTLERKDPEDRSPPAGPGRTRRVGGGRHKKIEEDGSEELHQAFEETVKPHTAGSPTDEKVKWVGLRPFQISMSLSDKGIEASPHIVKQLLEEHGYRNRAPRKELITGKVDPTRRNNQFLYIDELKNRYWDKGLPVLSVDTKKKELIGYFRRPGKCYATGERIVFDHDYRHLATGKGVPHGIYDGRENFGFMTIGTSAETSEFIADCLARWYHWCGQYWYSEADEVLLTFDAGGANGVNSKIFKEDMINLSARLELKIRIAHYPPYTSKWHPVEHRLFSQVERSLGGLVLDSYERLREAAANTMTTTGLWVKAYILDKVYETGRECSVHFNELIDTYLRRDVREGDWNYSIDARLLSAI